MSSKKKAHKRATPPIYREPEPLRLDLGSGPRPAPGFQGVDRVPGITDFDLNMCDGTSWPWSDNSVDELRSSHMIEHIDTVYLQGIDGYPGGEVDALYWFFDEAYRIAKPGAVFTIQWPALKSVRAFQDPTHRRFIPAETLTYLCIDGRKAMGEEHFGIKCNWIGTVAPTIMTQPESEEDKAMSLRADSSDDKIAWSNRKVAEQTKRYWNEWEFSQDFIAVLKAVK